MTVQIPFRIPEEDLARLDEAIARGKFPNRSAALRSAVELLLHEESERAIDEAYRRGYGEHPQEEWVGADGLVLFEALVRSEEKDVEAL